jgi:hypothetical protein
MRRRKSRPSSLAVASSLTTLRAIDRWRPAIAIVLTDLQIRVSGERVTTAYGANEQHEKRAQAASKLSELKPSTLQDLLLFAEAKSSSNFPEALTALNEAVAHYRTSVVARLTRGSVLVYRALETADTKLAESAIDDLRIASELLEPNALLLGRMM